jgi:hypothetical protein
MTVKEAVDLLGYGVAYEIKGAYSGKIYHKSYVNGSKNFDKYANREVTETPFYSDMRLRGADSNKWVMSIIGIWMYDYDLCKDGG